MAFSIKSGSQPEDKLKKPWMKNYEIYEHASGTIITEDGEVDGKPLIIEATTSSAAVRRFREKYPNLAIQLVYYDAVEIKEPSSISKDAEQSIRANVSYALFP